MNRYALPSVAVVGLLLFGGTAIAAAADGELLHVFDSGEKPDDSRLTHPRDLDHPAIFSPEFKDKEEWAKRATALRQQVLVAEGLWPLPARTPLDAVIHGKIDRDDYTVEKVYFASMPGHYVSGSLYRPKNIPAGRKVPAVLCPHGHWNGGRFLWNSDAACKKQIEEGAEQTMEGARSPLQARCAMLARMGCVVFHYDMIGYADSQPIEHRKGFTDAESILRLQSAMGVQTWNSIRALDFVQSLPEVDGQRIAVTGASGGGTQTLILGAADERPAVEFPAVMVSMNMQGGCVCENAPLLRVDTDNVELSAVFAPKPLGMTAANDWTIDLETKGQPELKSVYKLFGAEDRVAAKHLSFEHNYNQVSREVMYNFLNEHLKLGQPSPVKEKPFVPIEPKDLSVYDSEHPRPADALDAAALRKRMTDASDAQIAELAGNPEEYVRVLRTALRVMLCEPTEGLPRKGEVLAGRMSGPRPMGSLMTERGFIRRDGTGEQVPCAVIFPAHWNGTVVVWAHPEGKSSLFDNAGAFTPAVRKLTDGNAAVIAADLFCTGEYGNDAAPSNPNPAPKLNPSYAAFTLGYNRSLLANRVHDLLSVIALVRDWDGTKSIRLAGFGGPWALLARAQAGDAVDRAVVDLNGFDFDQVKESADPMMLPGAMKYGGIYAFVPLCTHGETHIVNARKAGKWELAGKTTGVKLEENKESEEEMAEWLVK
jgi:hypothetical protein